MGGNFINITEDNIGSEHLCCIIRSKKPHPGVEAKRSWLRERLAQGHVFRKLDAKGCCFIEYAPLEYAWTPIAGENYLYIYCLWVDGEFKRKGYGRELMEYCIADAKRQGRSGVCMLGADKQKAWLSDQSFAEKFGFTTADTTAGGYRLLALSFDGSTPRFTENAKRERIASQELTIYYSEQCPFIYQYIDGIRQYCGEKGVTAAIECVDTLEKAKALPCVFNNWAAFYKGEFLSVNLFDKSKLDKLLK